MILFFNVKTNIVSIIQKYPLNGDLFFENAIFEGLVAGLALFSSIN